MFMLYDVTSSRTFYFFLLYSVIIVVTNYHSNPNSRVLKIEK